MCGGGHDQQEGQGGQAQEGEEGQEGRAGGGRGNLSIYLSIRKEKALQVEEKDEVIYLSI